MATIHTLIDYDRQNPTAISREQYTDVGADAFSPGTFPRAFNDLEVWDAAAGGNQLVLDTDYEYAEVDYELSAANFESEAVYKKLRVINATYQVGSIWLTYSAMGTYPTADLHDASGLPAAGALDGSEPIATVQSSEMVKATPAQIDTYMRGLAETITVKTASYVILDDNLNVYEFSGAGADGTFTGPTLADNLGRVLEIHNADPTYKLTFDPEGAETIDGELTIDLDSQYDYCKVRAGTDGWHLIEYKDHGSNSDGEWRRLADGTMELRLAHADASTTINTATIGGFRSAEKILDLPQAADSTDYSAVVHSTCAAALTFRGGDTKSTTQYSFYYWRGSSSADAAVSADIILSCRWRA